jgi:sugar/nucleoside kinase (ribokinase family)
MSPIAVLSHIVVDDIHHADGWRTEDVGGAGAYAAVGASIAGSAGRAILVSGIGRADRDRLTRWCEQRGIATSGLFDASAHSPRTRIDYRADGERVERPVFGIDHFRAHTPLPQHIPHEWTELDGAYLFHDHDAAYWSAIDGFRAQSSCPILWEISIDSCLPAHRGSVQDRLGLVDALSINRTEAMRLFDTASLPDVVDRLSRLGTVVALRLGADGSLIVDGRSIVRVRSAPTEAGDPTGGGNAYSGAFLTAFADSGDPAAAARFATAVAASVVAGPGAPRVDDGVRRRIRSVADQLVETKEDRA